MPMFIINGAKIHYKKNIKYLQTRLLKKQTHNIPSKIHIDNSIKRTKYLADSFHFLNKNETHNVIRMQKTRPTSSSLYWK